MKGKPKRAAPDALYQCFNAFAAVGPNGEQIVVRRGAALRGDNLAVRVTPANFVVAGEALKDPSTPSEP